MKSLLATAPGNPPSCACRRLSAIAITTREPGRVSICRTSFENYLLVQVVGRLQPPLHFAIDLAGGTNLNAMGDAVFFRQPARVDQPFGQLPLVMGQGETKIDS